MVEAKMRKMHTNDQKVVERQIQNDILREVRMIEARVTARRVAEKKEERQLRMSATGRATSEGG